jgi:hypothetical protein
VTNPTHPRVTRKPTALTGTTSKTAMTMTTASAEARHIVHKNRNCANCGFGTRGCEETSAPDPADRWCTWHATAAETARGVHQPHTAPLVLVPAESQ